jgi:PAS domain S-box-containing protein
MGKETTAQKKMNELRQQAEKLLEKKAGKRVMSTDDMFKLSHELAVHQIELEMQAEELQQAQIELEKSRDKYIELFDFAPLGYFTLNKNNIIIEANLTAAKLLDMERRNLIRSKFTKFIAPESQDIFYSVYRKDFEPGGKRGCEIYMRRKDGTYFAASLEGVTRPDEEGHLTRRLIVVTDITERKRIEDSLSRSEKQFRSIFEKSPIGIGLCDDNGLLITCNQACLDVFGITDINEMRGFQFFKDLNITDDAKAILHRREIVKYEFSYDFKKVKKAKLYKTAKSGIIQLDIVVSPLFAAGQKIIGYLVHVQDITERKKAQDYVLKARDELEVQVKQRTAELERSIKELRLLASRLTLAEEHERRRIAKIFHDTFGQRMSLCSIQLGRLIRISTSDDLTQRLKEIQNNVKGILNETRQFIFEVSPAVLYDFGLEVALERLTTVLGQRHNVLINYKDDDKSKHLDEDIRVMLFQMTRELLMNVIRHAKAHRIDVSTIKRGSTIRITVQDDGVGFDKKILKTKGSEGMGLFSIGERITQIGGSAEIKSKIGSGTVITLAAPLKQESVKNTTSPITNLEL